MVSGIYTHDTATQPAPTTSPKAKPISKELRVFSQASARRPLPQNNVQPLSSTRQIVQKPEEEHSPFNYFLSGSNWYCER